MTQDLSGKNLKGHSFKGQNLKGANFSGADIRGADFTGANLTGANFSHAQAGLSFRWKIKLLIFSYVISILSGFFSVTAGITAVKRLSPSNIQTFNFLPSVIVLAVSIVLLITLFSQKLTPNSKTTIANLIAITLASTGSLVGATYGLIATIEVGANASSIALIGIAIVVLSQALATGISLTRFIAEVVAGKLPGKLVIVLAVTGSALGALIIAKDALLISVLLAALAALLGDYCGQGALAGNSTWALTRTVGIYFAAFGGTSFRNANLTDANFTAAILKSTDFRKANLTRTCFNKTKEKELDLVRPGTTYLQNAQLRKVLVTGQGQDKNFDREDLRGVNFQGANLVDTSFIGADLSQANLQDADLSRAKLVQAQLNGTDFTGTTLTGAYIQDWGITTDTKFDGVRCEYVYMQLPTKENPDPLRKPDNNKEVFADGEFGDFIKPIFDTLDLYHNQDVDPRAIAVAFKELAGNNPDAELEIVAVERRGEDKILLRVKTATTANKSELSKEYFINYNQLKSLAEKDFQALIDQQNSIIAYLSTMVSTALKRPSFFSNIYVEQGGTMTNNPGGVSIGGYVGGNVNNVQGEGNRVVQGNTTMTGDRNINTGGGNYNERIERDYIQGNYYAAGQPQSLAEAAAEIQLLLKQLEQTYPTNTTSQQMVVAAEAINRIESNPLLKERVINAVKSGGLAAFEKAIDNPAGAFIVGAIKGWQEVEAQD